VLILLRKELAGEILLNVFFTQLTTKLHVKLGHTRNLSVLYNAGD